MPLEAVVVTPIAIVPSSGCFLRHHLFHFLPGLFVPWFIALAVWRELGSQAQFVFANVDSGGVSVERLLVPSALNPLWWDFARKTLPLWTGACD